MNQFSPQNYSNEISMEHGYRGANQVYLPNNHHKQTGYALMDNMEGSLAYDDRSTKCDSMRDLQVEFSNCLEISPQSLYKEHNNPVLKLDGLRRHSDKPSSQFGFFESKEEEQEMLSKVRRKHTTTQPATPNLFFLEDHGFSDENGMSIESMLN